MKIVIALGMLTDILFALFLILVCGWIIDSWHDPNGVWVGISVTAMWLAAFVLSAGAPVLGRVLKRRGATSTRIALAVWAPVLILVTLCVVGFLIFPL